MTTAIMRTRRATYKCRQWRAMERLNSVKACNFKRLNFKRNVVNYYRELGFKVIETANGYLVLN